MHSTEINKSIKDEISQLSARIRNLSKIRLKLKKEIQNRCDHKNVTKTYMTKMPKTMGMSGDVAYNSSLIVKYKIVCKDCGKVFK